MSKTPVGTPPGGEETSDMANDRVQHAGTHAAVLTVALTLTPAVLRAVCDLNYVEFQGGERKETLARRLANDLHGVRTS